MVRAAAWWCAGLACVVLAACAASSSPPSAVSPIASEPMMPGDPRAQIDALDREIDAGLAELSVTPPLPACVAAASCAGLVPEPMAMPPVTEDPACQPGASDACTDTCTLAGSICENATRICELAQQLGGADAYANEKCAKGNASCDVARERCCTCV